jgi:hypothetical protein
VYQVTIQPTTYEETNASDEKKKSSPSSETKQYHFDSDAFPSANPSVNPIFLAHGGFINRLVPLSAENADNISNS